MEYLEVDGSQGEGGGQILRTAVVYSVIQKRPIRVSKIRAGRETPGLKRQHVSALGVLAEVFDGKLTGAVEGSSEVSFAPGSHKLDRLAVDMGTAASITLVLQAVVPAAALSGSKLSLELVGGTDVPWSPTFDYFDRVLQEAYAAVGIRFDAKVSRRGYYPRGGGRVRVDIEPCEKMNPLNLLGISHVGAAGIVSRCAMLPRHVAERQLSAAASVLDGAGIRSGQREVTEGDADSPGSSILIYSTGGGALLGCDAIGARGRPAEAVGREAAGSFIEAVRSRACVDSNLADMVLPLLSLAPGPSRVRVPSVSSHLKTGLALAKQFTSCEFAMVQEGSSWVVSVMPG